MKHMCEAHATTGTRTVARIAVMAVVFLTHLLSWAGGIDYAAFFRRWKDVPAHRLAYMGEHALARNEPRQRDGILHHGQ